MITISTADKALKNFYQGVVANQLNTKSNPFYNKIETTSKNVANGKIVKLAPYGLNGGFGFGTDTGALPTAGGNQYENFVSGLKDMFGVIKITDKAMKSSRSNAGAFVDLLKQEMEGITEAAKFNYSRALFTDGTGNLGTCSAHSSVNTITLTTVKYLIEGLIIDICGSNGSVKTAGRRITSIDRTNKTITISGDAVTTLNTDFVTVQGSYGNELTGLSKIFQTTGTLYGIERSTNSWLVPYIKTSAGAISDALIQEAIDDIDEKSGSVTDYISCANNVRRFYLAYLEDTKRNVNPLELEGGFRAISFNGIPLVADRHCPDGTMDLLSSKEFTLHQMADWEWMDDDGKILKQVAGYPHWTATIAKYGDLMCDKPSGQGRISGITS